MKQKIYIRFQTYDKNSLKNFKDKVQRLSLVQNMDFSFINLPVQKKSLSVLKSPHVNKKAKDHFEFRFYNGLVVLKSVGLNDRFLQEIKTFFNNKLLLKISVLN